MLSPNTAPTTTNRVLHLYHVNAPTGLEVTFIISIDPSPENDGYHTLTLFSKAGRIERTIGQPVVLRLDFDPRDALFDVGLSPKPGFPEHTLYTMRIWLRRQGFRHRLFNDDHFWIGCNPDFRMQWPGSAMAVLREISSTRHVHRAIVANIPVNFVTTLENINLYQGFEYSVSLEYEIGGVTRSLFGNIALRITCSLSELTFVMYTIPTKQTHSGSTHRLFFWVRSRGGICQRLWKTENFHLESNLDIGPDPDMLVGLPDTRNPIITRVALAKSETEDAARRKAPPPPPPFDFDASSVASGSRTMINGGGPSRILMEDDPFDDELDIAPAYQPRASPGYSGASFMEDRRSQSPMVRQQSQSRRSYVTSPVPLRA